MSAVSPNIKSGGGSMGEFRLFPKLAVWEVTLKCNMKCIHCGTDAGHGRPEPLTLDECLKVCDDLAEMGCEKLTVSGGEPLLSPYWDQIAKRATSNCIATSLITNGLLMTDEMAGKLYDSGLRVIGISVDGMEKAHNHVRRSKENSFQKCLEAIRTLHKHGGLNVTVISQISKININDLEPLKQMLLDEGVCAWQLQITTITGRMRGYREFAVEPSDLLRLAGFIADFRAEQRPMRIDVGENVGYFGPYEEELREGYPYLGCYAGCRVMGIEENGNIKGCLSMPEDYVEGNIRERPLKEIWEDMDCFSYNRKWSPDKAEGFCRACPHLTLCRCGCANTAVGVTGSRYNNPVCLYRYEQEQLSKNEKDRDEAFILLSSGEHH